MSVPKIPDAAGLPIIQDDSRVRPFASLMYDGHASGQEVPGPPPYFTDSNLGQVLESLCKGREEYDLAAFFYSKAPDLETISYRQEIFRDLQDRSLISGVQRFGAQMRKMRSYLRGAHAVRYKYQREGFFLDAAKTYCEAVATLQGVLSGSDLHSQGLKSFLRCLDDYVSSEKFRNLADDTRQRVEDLARVVYLVTIQGSRVTVSRYEGESDYSAEILQTFDRFKRGAAKDYRVAFRDLPEMNHVEAQISEQVAKLFPEVFEPLDKYCLQYADFRDTRIDVFDREVQFYLAYLEFLAPIGSSGLPFCFPEVTDQSKEVFAEATFDLALANKLGSQNNVVVNDFFLKDPERIIIVSGPNQGGKTTFARTFAQLHHLANIGCPVPGKRARLFHFDQLFTQFEKEEDLDNLAGKLETDLLRIHETLSAATSQSIIVLNEVFSSTTLHDARFLGQRMLERIIELDLLAVYVTFIDELATLPKTVSMISTIVPEDPAVRTYKVVRGGANGLAYAMAIAEKHGVTYERLRERFSR